MLDLSEHIDDWMSSKTVSIGWDIALVAAIGWVLIKLPVTMIFHALERSYIFYISDLLICGMFLVDSWIFRDVNRNVSSGRRGRSFEWFSAAPLFTMIYVLGLKLPWTPLFQANHLLRIPTLFRRFRLHTESTFLGKGIKIFFMLFGASVFMHWLACGYLLIYPQPETPMDPVTQYNVALYWTVTTLTTVGYGDITPSGNLARIYTMLVMLLGVGFYGFVIGQVSRYISAADKHKEMEKDRMEQLAAMFKHYHIPAGLQGQTMKFYKHLLNQTSIESEQELLSQLPPALREQIQIYMNIKPISNVPLFKNCSFDCLADAVKGLEHKFYSPGDRIITRGELGDEMYVIGYGTVIVHDDEKILAELSDGQCFGEMALIQAETRTADVTAKTWCDLFILEKEVFDKLLQEHDDLSANVEDIVEARSA